MPIPFSKTFDFVEGVDFSESMIAFTNEYLKDYENCRVHLNNGVDLSNLHSNEYDFVYSMITFQHIDSKQVIESYIREIHRVLKKSGYIKLQFMTPSLNSMKDWGTRRGYDFTSNEEGLEKFNWYEISDMLLSVYISSRLASYNIRFRMWYPAGLPVSFLIIWLR